MIRSLRRTHRVAWCCLALLLPVALALSLRARRPAPRMERLPAALGAAARGEGRALTWIGVALTARLADRDDLATVAVLPPSEPQPDLLLYWVRDQPALEAPLPGDAVLVGALHGPAGSTLELPVASPASGWLVAYSLGHQQVVGIASLGAPDAVREVHP